VNRGEGYLVRVVHFPDLIGPARDFPLIPKMATVKPTESNAWRFNRPPTAQKEQRRSPLSGLITRLGSFSRHAAAWNLNSKLAITLFLEHRFNMGGAPSPIASLGVALLERMEGRHNSDTSLTVGFTMSSALQA
jgi:hypothetical protein